MDVPAGILVRRIEVEEGFLDGLDLRFRPGLNVLIGPRGVGKTSVIELLRFCLDIPALTDRAATAARQQALSVLAGGRVTVTIEQGGEEYAVSRSADDDPKSLPFARSIIVLSQNEIEHVAKEGPSRLALIDSFLDADEFETRLGILAARLRSLSSEIRDALDDAESIQAQIAERAHADTELLAAELRQQELMTVVAATAEEQARLDHLQTELAAGSTREAVFQRTAGSLRNWGGHLETARSAAPHIEAWPPVAGGDDQLADVRNRAVQLATDLSQVATGVTRLLERLRDIEGQEARRRAALSQEAREIRVHLEAMQQGAGDIARRVSELRELSGQATALRSVLDERTGRIARLTNDRKSVWAKVQGVRRDRSSVRQGVAKGLEAALAPRISIQVSPSEGLARYASAIAASLRGSGLHYAALATSLSDSIEPRELAELIESGDASGLAAAGNIPIDRAARVIDSVRRSGVDEIIAASIEDTVSIRLRLDESIYRASEDLSTGQRCTVILPIVLSHRGRPVVVDQPEDNLDNAYVAETVVAALRSRESGDQYILATHNPNIPVLGDADQVVVLASEGNRGWVAHTGSLSDPETITSITSIMEGGAQAFSERARLYGLP